MLENEDKGLAYSFHLGNDKNKTKRARQAAKNNKSNTTSFSNNAIQNVKNLGKVNHHNLRKYDNNQELIKTIKGTNDIVKDVKRIYLEEFENARVEYNKKQTRNDRKIQDYFLQISNDTKHDLACEIIIELGDMKFWKDKTKEEKYKMEDVFKDQIEDLEKIVPEFKIANATIHYDESSPHLHIVGVAIKENCKTGMARQVGKTSIFTKESLRNIQDVMRLCCINSYNRVYELEEKLKKKTKGRNHDIESRQMDEFNKQINVIENNITELKDKVKELEQEKQMIIDEVNNLENTKQGISNEVEDLSLEKDNIKKEIDKKKSLNKKVVLKDKATLLKENEQLKHDLEFEKSLHYQYETMYNSLKEKTTYLIEQIKKLKDKIPQFIMTIITTIFDSYMNLDFFKQQYDEDYKKQKEKERKSSFNLFSKRSKNITPTEKEYDKPIKNKSKDKDDFDLDL